jgi:hypothetical protein
MSGTKASASAVRDVVDGVEMGDERGVIKD